MGREARGNIRSHEFNRPYLPVLARDALGRTLARGDLVILQPPSGHVAYEIVEVAREMDPRAAANTVRVVIRMQQALHATTGGLLPLILIAPQAEREAEPAATNEQAEDNGGPTLVLTDRQE